MTDTVIKPISMDIIEIMEMLPHRYPFLLVDRIVECVPGEYSKGYKNLTAILKGTNTFCRGIFPGTRLCRAFCRLKQWRRMLPPSF